MEKKDLNLEDFIPSYPYLENGENPKKNYYETEYELSNFNKQEFFEDLLDITEERPEEKGVPLKHQEFVAKFLSQKTLNNELLLFHQVGTGKTCSAINIAELALSMNSNLSRVLVLVKGETFIKNFNNELAFQCTPGQYIPENYSKLTSKEKVIRLNKNIRTKYEVKTFYKFAQEITKDSDETIEKNYSNRIILVDEVHNIKDYEQKKKEKRVYVYKQLHRFLHIIKNRKIVLLSATPMKDNSNEFASIMNLILPLDMQLPTKKDFNNEFFTNNNKLKNDDILRKYIRGRVSFLRSMETQLTKMNIGNKIDNLNYTLVDVDKMSNFQSEIYESAFKKDTTVVPIKDLKENSEENILMENESIFSGKLDSEESFEEELEESEDSKSGLYDNSRQASLFVFPNGKYGREGFNDSDNIEGKSHVFTKKLKNILTKNGTLTSPMDILKEIGKYSSKYEKALREIILNPKENCFVYSKFVKGSGLIIFAELLKLLGYKESKGNENPSELEDGVMRFALLSEKISTKLENNIKLFNRPENKHGKYIQVLLGSPLISEGRSFMNVRQIHILTPHWNMSETEQVTGRGIRAFSHRDLEEKDRYVKIFRHCSIPKNTIVQSIDYLMYEISELKDIKIKQIERICKETAIDCAFNKKRNLLTTDKDNSRECEYQSCKYVCENISDEYIQKKLEGMFKDRNIIDTYNLYYGDKLVKSTINVIQQLFKKNFSMHIKDIMNHFSDLSFILLVRSLKYMIQSNIPIFNQYGFICFLKYERNIFFLSDDIQTSNSYFVNYYCKEPPVYSLSKFKSIILENQSNNIENIIEYINTLDLNESIKLQNATELILELNPELQEQLIEFSVFSKLKEKFNLPDLSKKSTKVDKNLQLEETNIKDLCLKIFNSSIIELDNMFVSVHLLNEEEYRFIYKNAKSVEEWNYIYDNDSENILRKLKEREQEKVEEVKNIEDNDFGYYGFISREQVFRIKQTERSIIQEKGKDVMKKIKNDEGEEIWVPDKRKTRPGPGAVCTTMVPISKILNIIIKMYKKTDYFNVPKDYESPSLKEMKKELIENAKYSKEDIDKYSETDILTSYYWLKKYKNKKNEICDYIKKFFEKNNIIQYEK
jgi:superfamily II DNA or RNA helicase